MRILIHKIFAQTHHDRSILRIDDILIYFSSEINIIKLYKVTNIKKEAAKKKKRKK